MSGARRGRKDCRWAARLQGWMPKVKVNGDETGNLIAVAERD